MPDLLEANNIRGADRAFELFGCDVLLQHWNSVKLTSAIWLWLTIDGRWARLTLLCRAFAADSIPENCFFAYRRTDNGGYASYSLGADCRQAR